MPTVDKELADILVKHDGWYPGDHIRVVEITEYDNFAGGKGYGITYKGQPNVYKYPTEYIHNPKRYWKAK